MAVRRPSVIATDPLPSYHATVIDSALRADVVSAAIELLLDVGLEEFGMRALASRLGVAAPTLYRRVGDKNAILAMVSNELVGRIPSPKASDGPAIERVRRFATESFEFLRQHQVLLGIFSKGVVDGANMLRTVETWLGLFGELGLSPSDATHATKAMFRHIVGSVPMFESIKSLNGAAWAGQLQLKTSKGYPLCHAAGLAFSDDYYSATDFEAGLEILLRGILPDTASATC